MAIVTQSDYLEFSGISLDLELKKSNYDNPSRAVEIFLKRIEDYCVNYLMSNYFITQDEIDDDADMTAALKTGIMHQIDYIRKNGDMSISAINRLSTIAPNALMVWRVQGMCNITPPRDISMFGVS